MQVQNEKSAKVFALLSRQAIYTIIFPAKFPRETGSGEGGGPMIQQDEMKGGVKLSELVKQLGLAVVNKGKDYESALVGIRDVNRPGLQLAGYFDIDSAAVSRIPLNRAKSMEKDVRGMSSGTSLLTLPNTWLSVMTAAGFSLRAERAAGSSSG